jgi:hypothetical protein
MTDEARFDFVATAITQCRRGEQRGFDNLVKRIQQSAGIKVPLNSSEKNEICRFIQESDAHTIERLKTTLDTGVHPYHPDNRRGFGVHEKDRTPRHPRRDSGVCRFLLQPIRLGSRNGLDVVAGQGRPQTCRETFVEKNAHSGRGKRKGIPGFLKQRNRLLAADCWKILQEITQCVTTLEIIKQRAGGNAAFRQSMGSRSGFPAQSSQRNFSSCD